MLMLWLTSFLVGNPFENFDFKECLKEEASICAQRVIDHSKDGAESFLRRQCFEVQINQACLTLGKLYSLQNKDELAEGPLAWACGNNLADACLEAGFALERMNKEALSDDYYLFGCYARSHGKSCQAFAQNAREKRNWNESYKFYRKGCDLGVSSSCIQAAELGSFVGKNSTLIQVRLYKQACDLDSDSGCFKLAETLKEMGDTEGAKDYYKKSCLQDVEIACESFRELNGGGMVVKPLQEEAEKAKGLLQRAFEWLFPLDERL